MTQKKCKIGEERHQAAQEEANKLLKEGFIQKAHYTTWMANIVMVQKSNGKWWICINYIDLDKACPKDSYPLPTINQLVNGVVDWNILSFLDAYSGYNQI